LSIQIKPTIAMKKLIAFAFMVLFTTTLHAQNIRQRIDSVMNYYSQTFDFNGAAFVARKGAILLNEGYGYKDRYRNKKSDSKGIYMIGSMTKQFTAEIILMLAKEGKLSLDDKLNKFYPGYASGEKISLNNLLTHTSRIYNYTEDTFWSKHPTMALTHEQMLGIFKDKPLNFQPGEKFEYSNSNYILLTYIIEKVCSKPYTEVARERILNPVGMTHSGFDFTHLKSSDKVTGYNCVLIDSFYREQIVDSTQSLGAGAMYSTLEDLYKWHCALQTNKLLDKEWQQKAYVPYKDNYAYGWMIKPFLNQQVYAHSGSINGFYSYILRIENEDLCVIVLSNVQYNGANNNAIAKDLVRCFYDSSYHIPAPRKAIAMSPKIMNTYAGEYVLALDSSISLTFREKDNKFLATVTEQPEDRIYPQSENYFFAKGADAQFEFVKDGERGYKLLLHQHGQVFEARRKQ
jgi:CubicO group peptidase (beta-lactamase class C family)